MINLTIVQNTFNKNFDLGCKAKSEGDIELAKKHFILAVEAMQTLARNSTGDLKRVREERALSILDVIDQLSNPKAMAQRPNANQGNKSSKPGSNAGNDKPRDPNDTETVWKAAEVPNIFFDDIAGLDEVKLAVKRRVINPKKYSNLYSTFNVSSGGGIMMYGLPGTGKTMIAKAIAA